MEDPIFYFLIHCHKLGVAYFFFWCLYRAHHNTFLLIKVQFIDNII